MDYRNRVKILKTIKEHGHYVDLSEADLDLVIFRNKTSLRLTKDGFNILKKIFTIYTFDKPAELKSRHVRCLSNLEYPYFFVLKKLYLFSEIDAMAIKLSGGVERFLENAGS